MTARQSRQERIGDVAYIGVLVVIFLLTITVATYDILDALSDNPRYTRPANHQAPS